ncbi:hypothetical protein Cal7507_0305 [Calothrix sp. PCC 7507]|nr:hypothetical protein Cal7507_0305 [Calothrix sp. PCC 7507]
MQLIHQYLLLGIIFKNLTLWGEILILSVQSWYLISENYSIYSGSQMEYNIILRGVVARQ